MTVEMELVVDAGGDVQCIYDELLDLRHLGRLQITRASHVEPDSDGNWWADMGPVWGAGVGAVRDAGEKPRADEGWSGASPPLGSSSRIARRPTARPEARSRPADDMQTDPATDRPAAGGGE